MPFTADQITIAVTVYNRRDYLKQAIASALNQTVPVRVMVVEDCGPDEGLEAFVRAEFGPRVAYHRNRRRRGLFDNWNACLELCATPWLSILHDDDYLEPSFAEAMQALAQQAPDCSLYAGTVMAVDERGQPLHSCGPSLEKPWRRIDALDFAWDNQIAFPGQILRVERVLALGGFRAGSFYCGDWEMWFKLCLSDGAAQSRAQVAFARQHPGTERGTTQVDLSGRKYVLENIQRKRNLALWRRQGESTRFNRREVQKRSPLPLRSLISYGIHFSRRLLNYNVGLLTHSEPPHWRYAMFQAATRLGGWQFIRTASLFWRTFNHVKEIRRRP